MPDLLTTALETIQLPGMSLGTASRQLIDALNADLGTKYTTNDRGKWSRAEKPIPQPVQDWLLRVSIARAIHACGGKAPKTDEQLDRLAAMLCPAGKEKQAK